MSTIQRRVDHFIEEDLEMTSHAIIDMDFRETVLTHIIANYNPAMKMPLFLGIYGKPGEGKTFQTLEICRSFGIKICYFSGSELSGNYERDSILDIEDNYKRACNYFYGDEKVPCVIVIDDFHLSPASIKEGVGTTVNSQILTGFLMNLCDKARNTPNFRIPIILLGNTFENVYEPLKRDGRMDFYHWSAPEILKEDIVYKLFSDCIKKREGEKLKKLVMKYSNQPISFFAELRNDIEKREIRKQIKKLNKNDLNMYIRDYSKNKIQRTISIDEIVVLADKRIDASGAEVQGVT